MMDGIGRYYYKGAGEYPRISGVFTNGKPDGECTYYESVSQYYTTKWEDGECTRVIEE